MMMLSARSFRVRRLKALANISWLTTAQLEKLAGALTLTAHRKRSTIFTDQSSPQSAYILLSGVARITCVDRNGRRKMVILLSPGLIPAFPTAVAGITYNFRCEAVTSCQVGTIELKDFVKICLGIDATLFQQMAASFLGRWDRVHLRCANLINCTLDERLALILLDLTENFGVPNDKGGMRLTVPVSHRELAELIGVTRPRVTEHLTEFTEKHLISRQNGRFVVDHKGLEGFLMETHREGFSGELP
jgi:CRP/FNR family cyclic AMP-dependent transcriptional regulator